ncbi:MAG TPA: ATP-binding protein, partial [Chloroflexota bacterium]|nr:ATP-binding protein [Chloroflexota bacterium]
DKVRWTCDPATLAFDTTEQVTPLEGAVGQPRAVESLSFGLDVDVPGFNVFISGRPGTGRTSMVKSKLEELAATRPAPNDWCYVHNFGDASRPVAISLPAGQARGFAEDVRRLVDEVRRDLARAFESKQFRQRQEETHRAVEQARDQLMQELMKKAEAEGFGISFTPNGPAIFPVLNGKPMSEEELNLLPDEHRLRLMATGEELSRALREVFGQVRQVEKDIHERMTEQHRELAKSTVAPLIQSLQAKYSEHALVADYLSHLQDDLVAHDIDIWRQTSSDEEQPGQPPASPLEARAENPIFQRYAVNVVVDNGGSTGAPVIFESNPTYYNLFGRIEYQAHMGAMLTDFRQIKAGAVQRANGGYLVVNAQDVISSPFSWATLKRMLTTGQAQIENMGEQYTPVPAASLRPDPIPVNVKVVMIGPAQTYYLLRFYDEDFPELFRVRADFDTSVVRDDGAIGSYAEFISSQVRRLKLRHFDRTAVAKVIEYGARLVEDQTKLSAALNDVIDLLAEASYLAAKAGSEYVQAEHVTSAIEHKVHRGNLIEARLQEMVADGSILIDTDGRRVGQVNGLSVLDLGDYSFGRPVRITAQTALGAEGVLNIERETHLSGPLHTKGFLILTSLLLGRYGQDKPIALDARLTFEQTYDEVDGDSASCGELCCLLSSVSGLPLRQDLAITGSINQLGEVQAIGGVTRKVEGFYDLCAMRGLTGQQGVIVPASNVVNLMLREDVVDAVRDGRFHIWAVQTVDEALALLTGEPAGSRGEDGRWEPGTVNAQVDEKLRAFADRLKDFGRAVDQGEVRERVPAKVGPRTPRVVTLLRHLLTR